MRGGTQAVRKTGTGMDTRTKIDTVGMCFYWKTRKPIKKKQATERHRLKAAIQNQTWKVATANNICQSLRFLSLLRHFSVPLPAAINTPTPTHPHLQPPSPCPSPSTHPSIHPFHPFTRPPPARTPPPRMPRPCGGTTRGPRRTTPSTPPGCLCLPPTPPDMRVRRSVILDIS